MTVYKESAEAGCDNLGSLGKGEHEGDLSVAYRYRSSLIRARMPVPGKLAATYQEFGPVTKRSGGALFFWRPRGVFRTISYSRS